MTLKHRILRLVVAFAFGLVMAYGSYQWITNTERSDRRTEEERIVLASRDILRQYIGTPGLELSDPLNRVRAAGKVYIYPTDAGWEVSGHYRRLEEKIWHDFLLTLDPEGALQSLRVNDDDPALASLAQRDPRFTASR